MQGFGRKKKLARCFKWESYISVLRKKNRYDIFFSMEYCLLIAKGSLFWSFRGWKLWSFLSQKVDGYDIYWLLKSSCFELLRNEKHGLSWDKKLMKRWYLLNAEKFLFWTSCWWEIRSSLAKKIDAKIIFTLSFWAFHDIPGPGKNSVPCNVSTAHLTVCYYHFIYEFQSESTLHILPECEVTPCSKQTPYMKFKWEQRDSNQQPLITKTNTQNFRKTGQMSEECCDHFSVQWIWLYVIIMSRTSFKVNPHHIVCLNVKEILARSRRTS